MAKATTTRGPGTMVRDADAPLLANDPDVDADGENGSYTYVGRFDTCVVRLSYIGSDAATEAYISIEGAEDSSGTNGRVLGTFGPIVPASETADEDYVLRLSSVWLPYMRWAAQVIAGGWTVGDLFTIAVHTEYDKFTDGEDAGVEDAT